MDLVLGGGVLVLLFIAHVNRQGSLISAPQNAAGGGTDKVTLECYGRAPSGIKWSKITTNEDMPSIISPNTTLHPNTNPYFYAIENQTRYQYNLVISLDNRFDSGGRYMCEELGSTRKGLAHVIQLLTTALCHSSLGADRVVVEGESMTLTCSINYTTSSMDWPPSITWTGPDGIISDVIDESISGHVKVSLRLVGSPRLDGARFMALTNFQPYNGTFPEHHANNTPSYSKTMIFDPLIVHYQSQSVTFDPEKVSYVSGDSITCSSDGNPAVRYRWYDITDNTTVSAGAMVTITNTMVGDVRLACEAYNVIRGNVMAISRQIFFSTSSPSSCPPARNDDITVSQTNNCSSTSIIVSIVVGTLAANVVMTISIIMICRKLHSSQYTAKRERHRLSHNDPGPAVEATDFHDISNQHLDDGLVDVNHTYENRSQIDLQGSAVGNATYSNLVPTTDEPARSTEYEVLQH